MSTGADAYLKKQRIQQRDILYIVKEDRKTAIFLKSGAKVYTIIPAKKFKELMPDTLMSVNKGVLLAVDQIVSIEDGYYTMSDGSKHKGRVRTPGQHKRNRALLGGDGEGGICRSCSALEQTMAVFDKLPMAASIIEVVIDSNGHGVDFIFRYCNDELVRVEGVKAEDIVDHSFFEVFSEREKNWVSVYFDVAYNGVKRITDRVINPKNGKLFRIYCYQPVQNYCACILVPLDD